jgi:IS1 family transposase
MCSTVHLPKGDSPTLALVHPTEEEKFIQFKLNGAEWRGALSLQAYLHREATLSQQSLTKDGGISYWILVDTAMEGNPFDPESDTRLPLASCETYRKKALVWRDGEMQEVVSHGVGSVFCGQHLRKKGYAQRMMQELGKVLRTYQTGENECLFTILYSDIGKVWRNSCEGTNMLTATEILYRSWLGAFQFITRCSSRHVEQHKRSTRRSTAICGGFTRAM